MCRETRPILRKNIMNNTNVKTPEAECSEQFLDAEDTVLAPAYARTTGSEEEATPPSSNLDEKPAKNGFDEKVVEKTVRDINAALEKDQKKLAFALGKLLNDNYEAEKNRLGRKCLSMRNWAQALKDAGCKVGVSTMLQDAQLDRQNKVLPEEDIKGLSKTYLVVLLGQKDVSKKCQLARDARENGWSSNVLLQKVEASREGHSSIPRGRVAYVSPWYAKSFHSAEDTLRNVRREIRGVSNVLDLEAVKMPAARARVLLAEMDAAQKALEPVYAKLRELASAA